MTEVFDTSFYLDLLDPWESNLLKASIWKIVDNLSIEAKTCNPYDDLKERVSKFKPDLIAFTSYSFNIGIQRKLLSPLKKEFPEIKVIAGGVQVCLNPEDSINEPYIDMICNGEGEELIKEVCSRIETRENMENIKGLWIKKDNAIIRNGITDKVDINKNPTLNLDSYDPVQIYGLYEGHAYRMGHIETTRGCPYNCSYCGSGAMREVYRKSGDNRYIRHKDPVKLIQECTELKEKYNLEMFYFQDGTFTAKPLSLLEKLAPLYRKEVGLPFIALVRPETISKRVAELLGIMGCVHVSIGVESGVQSYREKVLNRRMSNQTIIDAVRFLRANNIHVSTYNMIGLPGMDRKHVFETIKLNKEAKPNSSIVSIFLPFPDNELTKTLISKGLITTTEIKSQLGATPNVEIKEMKAEEIIGLYDTFNLYVELPTFLYPIIELLEKQNPIANLARKVLYKFVR
ncbi:B12-binding domain-containing radical SAM protein [Candidatus Magnetominusculus dajiuhuensis]|uniref:B12-binding domain-containing radical SAM protein n=1 Tax=Candidatus Magnetominusculus dajiuhuensis TaxID=3137712 RepID=UPI003B42AB7B